MSRAQSSLLGVLRAPLHAALGHDGPVLHAHSPHLRLPRASLDVAIPITRLVLVVSHAISARLGAVVAPLAGADLLVRPGPIQSVSRADAIRPVGHVVAPLDGAAAVVYLVAAAHASVLGHVRAPLPEALLQDRQLGGLLELFSPFLDPPQLVRLGADQFLEVRGVPFQPGQGRALIDFKAHHHVVEAIFIVGRREGVVVVVENASLFLPLLFVLLSDVVPLPPLPSLTLAAPGLGRVVHVRAFSALPSLRDFDIIVPLALDAPRD
mmetsp:Transcript_17626/g.38196  ORF Transcript_17626/g.38196 Transcript_17626/m.38196 type:complete len:266 (+) Transcript_17626:456-1253(+)